MENAAVDDAPVKTPKQLEKEAKKLAKLEKFKQKLDKQSSGPAKEKTEVCFVFYFFFNRNS